MEESCQARQSGKVALVLGASGETGKVVVDSLINNPSFSKVILVNRRELELEKTSDKIIQKIVDFDHLDQYEDAFHGMDTAFCCLGTTRAVAGAEGFVKVDHDYVLAAAKLLKHNNCPEMHLLTSKGSNADSWFLYPSTKGKVENAVMELKFDRLSIYRPGLLVCHRNKRRFLGKDIVL